MGSSKPTSRGGSPVSNKFIIATHFAEMPLKLNIYSDFFPNFVIEKSEYLLCDLVTIGTETKYIWKSCCKVISAVTYVTLGVLSQCVGGGGSICRLPLKSGRN